MLILFASRIQDSLDCSEKGICVVSCAYFFRVQLCLTSSGIFPGETPLIHAARQGHSDTARYLVESGANPAIASDLGATALHHSAGIGKFIFFNPSSFFLLPCLW